MIDKVSPNKCCLCRACFEICPTGAINFTVFENGFNYPAIDLAKCINCQKCERVCPELNNTFDVESSFPIVYAGNSTDYEIRANSSSGGIFFEITKKVIANGGYVAGAVFKEHFQVKHMVTNDIETVKRMCGSKYAQSDNIGEFNKIKDLLKVGKQVLFCGCPCQVAGLKKFLGNKTEKLITIDFICHGIPSQEMLDAYVAYRENKMKSKIVDLKFRDKQKGWHSSCFCCSYENGKKYSNPITVDPYMKGFLNGYNLKEACYTCKYKNSSSGSDITLADFWGAEALYPKLDDNKGLSAIIVNSSIGSEILDTLNLNLMKIQLEEVVKYNKNYTTPTKMHSERRDFFECVNNEGYAKAIESFFCESKREEIKRKILYYTRCIVHKIRGQEKPLY